MQGKVTLLLTIVMLSCVHILHLPLVCDSWFSVCLCICALMGQMRGRGGREGGREREGEREREEHQWNTKVKFCTSIALSLL